MIFDTKDVKELSAPILPKSAHLSYKKLWKETLCDIQVSPLIFLLFHIVNSRCNFWWNTVKIKCYYFRRKLFRFWNKRFCQRSILTASKMYELSFSSISIRNKNTLTGPVDCKKTNRHHAHLSLWAKSRKTDDSKSRMAKTSIWAIFWRFRG